MYKNIVFDVGGVLLEYRWKAAICDAGATPKQADELGELMFDHPLWTELDLGIRPYDDIVEDFCKLVPDRAHILREFLNRVERMPIPRPRVYEEVKRLKDKGYKLYILSNYSEKMFTTHTGDKPFPELMDGMMVSYMVGKVKPDKGIYEALLTRFGLNASDCLFFDDRAENVDAAIENGIAAIKVTSEEQLLEELSKL